MKAMYIPNVDPHYAMNKSLICEDCNSDDYSQDIETFFLDSGARYYSMR